VRVPEYALDNQPDIQFASVFGLTTKFSNAPSAGASHNVLQARRPDRKKCFWVKPLAPMPRFTLRAATAEMMSGFDCAQVLPVKRFSVVHRDAVIRVYDSAS
jgi:hypothetical protein